MSARTDRNNRKAAPVVSDESQLWQVVKGHLRAMDTSEQAASQMIRDVEKKRQAYIEQRKQRKTESEGDISKEAVRSLYQQLEALYEEDLQEAGKALEKLEVLIAIRDDPSTDATSKRKKRRTDTSISVNSSTSPPLIVTPAKERQISPMMTIGKEDCNTNTTSSSSTNNNAAGSSLVPPSTTTDREKKRSNSKSNGSSSTATSSHQQQRRGTVSSTSAKDAQTTGGGSGTNSSHGGSSHKDNSNNINNSKDNSTTTTASATSSTGYVDPARARREVLAHQLPLQKGRKVAFRQPPKTKSGPGAANVSSMTSRSASSAAASAQGGGSGGNGAGQGSTGGAGATAAAQEDEGEQWIMATIIECINNDRNRYVVVDAEDAAMPTYNTTLKAIVPLPESLATLPSEDYKVGTQVMGLYPDTSCFYQAIVQSGGPGMNGKIMAKMQRRADEILHTPYQLIFEDDGDAIQDVPACFVVERP